MEKSNRPILVGIIVILAVVAIYMFATRERGGGNDDLGNTDLAPQTQPAGGSADVAGQESEPVAGGQAATPNYMEPQPPVPLTDGQRAQLAAGAAAHEPKELTFDVSGGSFYYVPNELRVKQGDRVRIVFTNAGGTHDFVLPEFDVRTKITKTGENDSVEFTADKKGSFEFYCSVGNGYHRQMGQTGTLIVE